VLECARGREGPGGRFISIPPRIQSAGGALGAGVGCGCSVCRPVGHVRNCRLKAGKTLPVFGNPFVLVSWNVRLPDLMGRALAGRVLQVGPKKWPLQPHQPSRRMWHTGKRWPKRLARFAEPSPPIPLSVRCANGNSHQRTAAHNGRSLSVPRLQCAMWALRSVNQADHGRDPERPH
jgi:hypothetical protein